jgi:hypothetical protein
MNMTSRQWLRGLLAAAISSASTAILACVGVPVFGMAVNWNTVKLVLIFIGADVLVSLATFLKANPLPDDALGNSAGLSATFPRSTPPSSINTPEKEL